jgi:nitrilase
LKNPAAKGHIDMSASGDSDCLTVGIAQISPVWLDRERTLDKIIEYVRLAAQESCQLVVFGEALLPGYPFWIELTDGARFNSPFQKEIHAHYMHNAIQIEAGHLERLCEAAARQQIAVVLGCIERALDRGGHSLYALRSSTSIQAELYARFIANLCPHTKSG